MGALCQPALQAAVCRLHAPALGCLLPVERLPAPGGERHCVLKTQRACGTWGVCLPPVVVQLFQLKSSNSLCPGDTGEIIEKTSTDVFISEILIL